MVKNSYPELPEIPYQKTSIPIEKVVEYGKTLGFSKKVLSMAYAIFRNESANGSRGVNNNYAGIQADVGKWTNLPGDPIGTCVKIDSGGANRRFLCFGEDGYKISFALLCAKVEKRGMFTAQDYFAKWVGNTKQPEAAVKSFNSMLAQGDKLFA